MDAADDAQAGGRTGQAAPQRPAGQRSQAGRAGRRQKGERRMGGAFVVIGAQDHCKVGRKPAQQQHQRPDQRLDTGGAALEAEQRERGRKKEQQRQRMVFEHVQAVEKAHGVARQHAFIVIEEGSAVVVAARGDQNDKTGRSAAQPAPHPGRHALAARQQPPDAQNQTHEHPGAAVFAQPTGQDPGQRHADRHARAGGKRLLQIIAPGQKKGKEPQAGPQIVAGAAHPEVGLPERRADFPQRRFDQEKAQNIIPPAPPSGRKAVDDEPQP